MGRVGWDSEGRSRTDQGRAERSTWREKKDLIPRECGAGEDRRWQTSGRSAWLRGPRVLQERVELSLDLPEPVPQFAANRLGHVQQDATVFGQRKQAAPLAIVHRDHLDRKSTRLNSSHSC